jgi:uncharacterized protein (TIGR02246 family)
VKALPCAAAIAAFALGTGACAARGSQTSGCKAEKHALQAVIVGLIAGDNSGDLEQVLNSYTEEIVWLPPRGASLEGKAAIQLRYEKMFDDYRPFISVVVSESQRDGRLGFIRGRTSGHLEPIGTGQPLTIDDKFLAILQCTDGRWKVSHLAWSPHNN